MSEEPNIPDVFRAYEEGKHRRYNLLFAVNGGAFAVAQLFSDALKQRPDSDKNVLEIPFLGLGDLTALDIPFLGYLSLWQLSLGMTIFTTVMVMDIFMFGENMRKEMSGLFGWQGKLVLFLIGFLIAVGWTLVSFGTLVLALVILGYIGIFAAAYFLPKLLEKRPEKMDPLPDDLTQLNVDTFHAQNKSQIGENREEWKRFLERILANDFVFHRASREVEGRKEMIEQIQRDKCEREDPTDVSGGVAGDYGVVTSIITVKGKPNKYHNFKVFERQPPGEWQCVYWRVTEVMHQ
jgi:hypothetical protein